jgi:P27 family predicted phage terminase small subunit
MPGPPPIPFSLQRLRGNPDKKRLRPEPQPVVDPQCPEPPPFVTGYAADEWWRVAPELHRLGLLTVIDVATLAAYCTSYQLWRQAQEALERMASRDESMHGLLVKSADGNARRNSLAKIVADAASDMVRYSGEFGLTPVARARIAHGLGWQPPGGGKFDGLLR